MLDVPHVGENTISQNIGKRGGGKGGEQGDLSGGSRRGRGIEVKKQYKKIVGGRGEYPWFLLPTRVVLNSWYIQISLTRKVSFLRSEKGVKKKLLGSGNW